MPKFRPAAAGWFMKLKWRPDPIHMPQFGLYRSMKPNGP
jgi:hypothetical protein